MPYKSKAVQKEYNRQYYQNNKEKNKVYREKRKAEYNEYAKKYYQNNKEVVQERHKKYRYDNKEVSIKYARKYYQNNKERILKYTNKYYQNNKERITKRASKYHQNNKEEASIRRHRRRARIAEVGGGFTKTDIKDLYISQWMRCWYCSVSIEEKYHIDHMTPISRSGSNWIDNLCLTCPNCNLTKHTQTAEEFIEQKGFMYGI